MKQSESTQDIVIGSIVTVCMLIIGVILSFLFFPLETRTGTSNLPLITSIAALMGAIFTGGLLYFAYKATKDWDIRVKKQARYDIVKLVSENHLGMAVYLKGKLKNALSDIESKNWKSKTALALEPAELALIDDLKEEFQNAMQSKIESNALIIASEISYVDVEGAIDFQNYHDALFEIIEEFEASKSDDIYAITAENESRITNCIKRFEEASTKFINAFKAS